MVILKKKGFYIKKTIDNIEFINKLKNELTVSPEGFKNFGVKQEEIFYPVYIENEKHLIIPKFYGLKYFPEYKDKQKEGKPINVEFKGHLRDYQLDIVNSAINHLNTKQGGLISLGCGQGKCLGKDTLVYVIKDLESNQLLIKRVQDLTRFDYLVGLDIKPREIINLTFGKGQMYNIIQSDGMTYRVNDAHILTLFHIPSKSIIDINIEELINNYNIFEFRGIRYKDNEIVLSILTIKKDNIDDYYGFELNKDKRFLLGDGTFTHNTVISLNIACHFKLKTLIIVHKTFLLNQWKERIEQFTNASIGILQRDKIDYKKDFVIGMLQSIAKDKYPEKYFKNFGLVIFDEAHHAPSQYFSKALPMISCKRTLALSATPERNDKMEKVLYWYFGDVIHKADKKKNNKVIVQLIDYTLNNKNFKEFKLGFTGDVNKPKTITNLTTIKERNLFIIQTIKDLFDNPERNILILSDRVEHLNTLYELLLIHIKFNNKDDPDMGFYIGKLKQKDLDKSATKRIILATYGMAAEALDIPQLNTLILSTPRSDVEQAVGRILRKQDYHLEPIIIDIVDNLKSCSNQSNHRKKLYRKMDFNIIIKKYIDNNIIFTKDMQSIDNNIQHIDDMQNDDDNMQSINNMDFID
ncbi:putative VV A18-like helicase [Chlorella virus XW01]|nr:putative VV A18-like helicase [Chlorella virus XW01]